MQGLVSVLREKSKIILFSSLVVIVATLMSAVTYAQEVGQVAPDFSMTDIDGNLFKLTDYRGKIVILNFFTIFWPNSGGEMEQRARFRSKHHTIKFI